MVRWTFFLVAFVFLAYSLSVLAGAVVCARWPEIKGCGEGKISDAFNSLLASALAYAAGQRGSSK
jgi:hypothetical protein